MSSTPDISEFIMPIIGSWHVPVTLILIFEREPQGLDGRTIGATLSGARLKRCKVFITLRSFETILSRFVRSKREQERQVLLEKRAHAACS